MWNHGSPENRVWVHREDRGVKKKSRWREEQSNVHKHGWNTEQQSLYGSWSANLNQFVTRLHRGNMVKEGIRLREISIWGQPFTILKSIFYLKGGAKHTVFIPYHEICELKIIAKLTPVSYCLVEISFLTQTLILLDISICVWRLGQNGCH